MKLISLKKKGNRREISISDPLYEGSKNDDTCLTGKSTDTTETVEGTRASTEKIMRTGSNNIGIFQ